MYSTFSKFINDWQQESDATIKLFEKITNDKLSQKVYSDGRTMGFIAWHIVYTVGEILHTVGIQLDGFDIDENMPNDMKIIIDNYQKFSKSLIEIVSQMTDDKLEEEFQVYGEIWKFCDLLKGLVFHQIHHRGQLTVLMRQAGLPVVGIYGPSKEEWAQFGMDAPD